MKSFDTTITNKSDGIENKFKEREQFYILSFCENLNPKLITNEIHKFTKKIKSYLPMK